MSYRVTARSNIKRIKRDLENLFLRAEVLPEQDEITGEINRYLIVRTCGFLEQSLVLAARSLCESRSGAEALRFAHSWLERSPNPRKDEILKLVHRFNETWSDELVVILNQDEKGSRINALVGIRNDIAHGKNQGVSRRQAWEYFQLASEIVDWVLERFEPQQ